MLLPSVLCHAQTRKIIVAPKADTIPTFRGMALSFDLVGAAQMQLSDYGQYEAALRVNIKDKYFPIVEIGYGKADSEDINTNLRYKTGAPYGKVGLDFNIMKNKHDIYRVYAGFRYALTYFKYDLSSQGITDPVWKDKSDFSGNDIKCNYHWLEGVVGVDAKIAGPIRLGWSVRYRRRLFHDEGTMGNAWYVPGFGKTSNARLGGTFNVIIEL